MAQSITLGPTAVPIGPRVFLIDGLPVNSSGFELVAGRNASWAAAGPLFSVTVQIALDGVNFQPWIALNIGGGPGLDPRGDPTTTWRMVGTWPGENDGTGTNKRRVLRATDLRITLNVVRGSFSIESLGLRTV